MMMLFECLEGGPVSVEEVLLSLSVPVHTTFSGITEERVGKSRQCSELGLVALSTHVHNHSLTACRAAVVTGRKRLVAVLPSLAVQQLF